MAGLEGLYQQIILDHSKERHGDRPLEGADGEHHEYNPTCGDEITVFLDVESKDGVDVVSDVKVSGQGCSISQSSASMMSQAIKGKTVPEVRALVRRFKGMMSIETDTDGDIADADVPLGDLEALQGVVKFPVRIKCATLAWSTLTQALDTPA